MTNKAAGNILIVDDIPNNLIVLEQLFYESPYHLVKATSGKDALAKALEQDFDLMILDVKMPEMDGFEVAAMLRSRNRTKFVPIIFLTAGEIDEYGIYKAYESGAVDFLRKPYHPEILRAKCKTLIELECNRKELLRANGELKLEISARQNAQKELIAYRDELEQTVAERTASLHRKNGELLTQIEERKRIEALLVHLKDKAESATRTKDIFLANLSHELRTPLNAIIGFSTLMLDPDFKENAAKREEHLLRIQKAGKHLLGLINDLLGFSMMETGQSKLERRPLILVDVLMGSLNMIKSVAIEKSIEIETDIGQLGIIFSDRTRLMQVMVNLLSNAVKFTPEGGKIGIKCAEEAGDIMVTVWDTGIGIAKEKLNDIFMEFRQVEEDLSRRYGGVGLGLAIVRRILDNMGGRIWAESQLGVGSKFFVALPPCIKVAPEEVTQAFKGKKAGELRQRSQKCLVIVGEIATRVLITDGLNQRGHVVIEADAGAVGLVLAEQELPDIIILDMDLPEASAIDVISSIKRHSLMAHIPLFVIAARCTAKELDYLKESGCQGILDKPIDIEHLAKDIMLMKAGLIV